MNKVAKEMGARAATIALVETAVYIGTVLNFPSSPRLIP